MYTIRRQLKANVEKIRKKEEKSQRILDRGKRRERGWRERGGRERGGGGGG